MENAASRTSMHSIVPMPLTFGSLFAGIGGIDLGFERAGMVCKWQVEIDEYARRVLGKHWPNVRRWDDVCTWPQPDTRSVDCIVGGFPCQDISNAGKRAGIDGERSGLWREYIRIVRELRPRFIVVENVAALLVRGMGRVLGDLAESGYDAEWRVLSAREFGAPHIRRRLFIVANASSERIHFKRGWFARAGRQNAILVDGDGKVCEVANADGEGLERRTQDDLRTNRKQANAKRSRMPVERPGWWTVEPELGRVAHGVSSRVDRLRGIGNAVVPQVAEWIGRQLVAAAS